VSLRLRADDRVLFLEIPEPDALAAIARILVQGVVVAMGSPDNVDRARRALAEFDNVMLLDAAAGRIPWRDAYFTKVVVPVALSGSSDPEWTRLLAADGEIILEG
jgi:hypothetical protein